MQNQMSCILRAFITIVFFFGISGCGINNYFLSKQDLSQVNDRLGVIEKQFEIEKSKTGLLLEQIHKQEGMLQQIQEHEQISQQAEKEFISSFEAFQVQMLQNHQQTERRLAALKRGLVLDQQTSPGYQQPALQNMDTEKLLIGRLERVRVIPPGQVFHARIDTGATTSSLDARDIRVFERDGSKWVHFQIQDPEKKDSYYDVERPIVRWVKIIQAANEEASRRPVVNLQFQIGRIERMEEFTLEDRSHMDYQALIGRNVLRDLMVVDVAHKFLAPLPQEEINGKNHQ
jgi:hypothetical protein